ncbi:ATP-binding protein [Pontiella sp.]|uniref:ATP-binding protein n=1 Tax=Pontiella sp. TaxID=2837462 RepID=UPI00356502A3
MKTAWIAQGWAPPKLRLKAAGLLALLLATSAVAQDAQGSSAPQANEPPQNYRILFMDSLIEPWGLAMFSACRAEFERLSGRPVEMLIDHLTSGGHAEESVLRIAPGKFDYLVCRDLAARPPVDLAARANLPMIIPTCDDAWIDDPGQIPPNVYVATIHLSPARTAKTALELVPQTRKLVVISGAHDSDRFWEARAREELGDRFQGVAVEYWNNCSLAELTRRAALLPADHLILFLKMTRAPDGTIYIPRDVVRELVQSSPVPVFGTTDTFIEEGILGGYVLSSAMTGKRGGEMLARLAHGETVPALTHIEDYGEYRFNWEEMKRWGIRESRLPAGSRILNRPDSVWGRHPWGAGLLAALGGTGVLVLGTALLVQRCHRRTELRHRKQIIASKALLLEAQQIAQIGNWTLDPATETLWWSEEVFRIFGRDPADGQPPYSDYPTIVHPDDWPRFDAAVRAATGAGTPYDLTLRILRPDGSERIVNSICKPRKDESGAVVDLHGMVQDVTDLKRAEAALRQNEQRYQSLFDHSPVPLWEEDLSAVKRYIEALKKDGVRDFRQYWAMHPEAVETCAQRVKVIDVNSAALALHEAPSKQTLLAGLPSIFTEKSYEVFAEQLLAIAEGRMSHEANSTVKTLAGQERSILLRWSVVPGHENTLGRVYVSTVDVTAQKQAEEALRLAHDQLDSRVKDRTAELKIRTDEAETLNRAMINLLQDLKETNRGLEHAQRALRTTNGELEAFSYSVSHDLRAPLRHINGFVSLLLKRERGRLDATSARYLDTIAHAAERMGHLIDDLLAFSRTSRVEMHLQTVAPNDVVKAAIAEQAPAMKDRRIVWQVGDLPDVLADRGLLLLVWQNLIGNAIKYTGPREEARIEIGAEQRGQMEGGEEITFFIRDNGVGFDPQYTDKLFGVFQRLHRDDEFEGTGIGLATVQRIVHRHGGRVWAEGKTEHGATFYFTLRETKGTT